MRIILDKHPNILWRPFVFQSKLVGPYILILVKRRLHVCVAKHAQTSLGISWADQLTVPAAAAGALHHAQPPPAAWPGHGDTRLYTDTGTGNTH